MIDVSWKKMVNIRSDSLFGFLFKEHLKKMNKPRTVICEELSDILPLAKSTLLEYLGAYSQGAIFFPYSVGPGSVSKEEKRDRRNNILYALSVEQDSDLIIALEKLDPQMQYPPKQILKTDKYSE